MVCLAHLRFPYSLTLEVACIVASITRMYTTREGIGEEELMNRNIIQQGFN